MPKVPEQLPLFTEPEAEQLPLFESPVSAAEPEAPPKPAKTRLRFLALDDPARPRNRAKGVPSR